VPVFRQKSTLEDAIGSHACSLEANTRVTNGISLGSSLLLPIDTVNCVQTLKDKTFEIASAGSVQVVDASGTVLLEIGVEAGDIWYGALPSLSASPS
jgi:hypothetical protein